MSHEREMLAGFRLLCAEWHGLSDAASDAGKSDDPTAAHHAAYRALEREVERLYSVPIDSPPFGWLLPSGGLTCGADSWGALAHAIMLHDWDGRLVPVTREEAYAAMGWGDPPPLPTAEEVAATGRLLEAMARMGDRSREVETEHGLRVNLTVMDRNYLQEMVANVHEIEAEQPPNGNAR